MLRKEAVALLAIALSACVTTAPSPVDRTFTEALAPPVVTVLFADEDGLPRSYDVALQEAGLTQERPVAGSAARWVEEALTEELSAVLAGTYAGASPASLRVEITNVVLPDSTRFTPASGRKSFAVEMVMKGPDGAVLAETRRPFIVLAEHQRGRFGGPAWKRLGQTDRLRAEAIALLTDATGVAVVEALTGGKAQTGLSGKLVAYPARLPD